jgi:1,4-dihydroxy-2-naphthoate polyprenyltransferase
MLDASQQIDRPSPSLARPGIVAAAQRAFLATRPPFFVASVMPVLIGTAWASAALHHFSALLFGLALAATVFAHAATNVYNDVGDDVIGADGANTDRIYPYTGGSRFIQTGLLSRAQMTHLALGLTVVAMLLGLLLVVLRGQGVVLLGLLGLGLGLLYSLPGAQLSARGIGEAAVAIGFGALPVLGTVWLQAGFIDLGAILICLPLCAWAAAILIINEVPDMEADRRVHKRTLVVRWGTGGAQWIYRCLTLVAFVASVAAILYRALPLWYGLPAVVLAASGYWAARGISTQRDARPRLKRSIEVTLAIHALGCIALLVAIWSTRTG